MEEELDKQIYKYLLKQPNLSATYIELCLVAPLGGAGKDRGNNISAALKLLELRSVLTSHVDPKRGSTYRLNQ